jgi:hypothetical protein
MIEHEQSRDGDPRSEVIQVVSAQALEHNQRPRDAEGGDEVEAGPCGVWVIPVFKE